MMSGFPAVFVSHGSPMLALEPGAATDFLAHLGQVLGRPRAILVVSAHWESPVATVSTAAQPATIHDFGGFPEALYRLQYPAPGAPDLAASGVRLLEAADIPVRTHPTRGLDHGAWVPLLRMFPEAKIPVTQLSIQTHLGPAYHLRLGRALAPLREEGVLILASGSATHNLYEFRGQHLDAPPPAWVTRFDRWLAEALQQRDLDALVHYRTLAPEAGRNHPTEEHLLPLFVALGAGGAPVLLHSSYTYGVLSMAVYGFGVGDSTADLGTELQGKSDANPSVSISSVIP